ncbi:pyruvate-flavodoxin oxidoreductase [Siculibacillus lacustris]|uniref:Pyruvate-flavodoxin oxidoreductase n=1 Tax=Siculibacillus lacustris TaxID=1549641 RepID=A0A4Q9VM70_9HYPH|nr:2-oxoacid:acceptor oxidoreductase family protein [Siculibacillus lacustris]TBW36635.1 pyruvate-flavodoxin oxidoreductase [Siculibacillus lacustris]
MNAKFPGIPSVINGNGAVAQVMGHVCGGVIGYPITPSTEISEIYEGFRAGGGCNVWGRHPFFYEPEGEHSAQSGALGAALTGGKYVSNASSSQGILYGLESHYVTVGKKVGGFVLQVAARVVSKHSLNVMAGHDDVYALLSSGYTILFGANPQEAADFAAISYKVSANSLIPVANAMDGFATSHMLSEALMPEPELLREFLGDPSGRMPAPTVAQELLFGAKGRVHQLRHWLGRNKADFVAADLGALYAYLDANAAAVEADNDGEMIAETLDRVPDAQRAPWRRQWLNAHEKGTRQRVPALVDVHNPGLTGGVQNQPDFQAGAVDHRTHFVADVPHFVDEAFREYADLTGREYAPVMTYHCDDAETVMVGLGSVTDDVEAVVAHLRAQGRKVGVVAIKLLQPFPEAQVVAALAGKRAVTILERSDVTALTGLVTQALFRALENADGDRHTGIPAITKLPKITTAIFGLGAHDLQPRHLVAAFDNMDAEKNAPFVYLGSQFFSKNPTPRMAELQARLKAAYPETEFMALETGENPALLPKDAFRVRFHSVGGYGTIATGKLLTDILAGVLGLYSKSAPKYGSEKSGAPTNYYITLSPEPVKLTNAEIEDVEIVISPDHKVFSHTDPLRGLVPGGTFMMQSNLSPLELWLDLPAKARKTIRDKKIRFYVIDAFKVAEHHAPTPELQTRMMGIAFIGALCGNVERIMSGADEATILTKVRQQIGKKFGGKGDAVVEGNMAVIREGLEATVAIPYDDPDYLEAETDLVPKPARGVAISAAMCKVGSSANPSGMFDREYYEEMVARPFKDGTIGESPVLPGTGLFMPAGSAAMKDKGLFRRQVPIFDADKCTGCLECTLVCPDAALPSTIHDIDDLIATALRQIDLPEARRAEIGARVPALADATRAALKNPKAKRFHEVFATVAAEQAGDDAALALDLAKAAETLAAFPVSKTRLYFDQMEKQKPGTGGLYSVGVDPWKCSGCLECTTVCGAGALVQQEQDAALLDELQARFEFLGQTANTPSRFTDNLTSANARRLILDRDNYYATTGGHGACRGCGEVTAIRLLIAASHSIHGKQRKQQIVEIGGLIDALGAKLETVGDDKVRAGRIEATIETLEKRLYHLESGPTGNGPASTVVANATGCSSVYSSTFPFNPYVDPWVNSLFQDAPALAKGIFEGLSANASEDFRALRVARLELEDAYDPKVHDRFFRTFGWDQFTPQELALLPTVISMGGDGATYDIGFGALSRLLSTHTPVKVVVLNTGAYSNTGGQASTSSLTGQDSDLARVGAAHAGKQDDRKELGLIAAFHPKVMVVQTSTALQGHFLKNVLAVLAHNSSPAVLDIYTPCQGEHGIGDAVSSEHSRLAVESRTSPVFVHDPDRGTTMHEWFSLDGNPDVDQDWTTTTLEYVDDDGVEQTLDVPVTPADFAHHEGRFKKQFHNKPLAADVVGVPVHEYIDLPLADRAGKTPFIWAVENRKLVRYDVAPTIVHLVEERRRSWRTLQVLAGFDVERIDESHRIELEALQSRYLQALESNVPAPMAATISQAAGIPAAATAAPL